MIPWYKSFTHHPFIHPSFDRTSTWYSRLRLVYIVTKTKWIYDRLWVAFKLYVPSLLSTSGFGRVLYYWRRILTTVFYLWYKFSRYGLLFFPRIIHYHSTAFPFWIASSSKITSIDDGQTILSIMSSPQAVTSLSQIWLHFFFLTFDSIPSSLTRTQDRSERHFNIASASLTTTVPGNRHHFYYID